MDFGLKDKVVVITGASRGIGRATAQDFAREGAQVVISSRSEARLTEAAAGIQAAIGVKVVTIPCDVRDGAAVDNLLKQSAAHLGGIDVLVNNVTGIVPKRYEEGTLDDWHEVFDQKLLGYITTSEKVLPYMRQRGGGRIINVIGTAAREPNPWTTSTGIVNAGLSNFTKTFSNHAAADNILVNAVSPGPIDTDRWKGIAAGKGETADAILSMIPIGRIGQPEEVAAAIVFLASSRATFITGACLTVDGGRSASADF